MTIGTYLIAGNAHLIKNQNDIQLFTVNTIISNDYITSELSFYLLNDTVTTNQNDSIKTEFIQEEKFLIPPQLKKIPINFRINSSISYLSFDHFIGNESQKLFFQAWFKERELKKLSVVTDSLRKSYVNASLKQKEEISSQIIKAEKQSIALNEEIPEMYQKAREEEDRYWQAASLDKIVRFQEKIKLYQDSIAQLNGNKPREKTINAEISDTITLVKPAPKATEKTAVANRDIIYKIQIGAFKGKIPESNNKLIKKISMIRKVENHVDDKKLKIYTTGNLKLYSEAVTMLGQVKQEGIKNATITAYLNGKKTTVAEARKLNNETSHE